MPDHCPHWIEGSAGCHWCGDYPLLDRLVFVLGIGPKRVDPPCTTENHVPCTAAVEEGS